MTVLTAWMMLGELSGYGPCEPSSPKALELRRRSAQRRATSAADLALIERLYDEARRGGDAVVMTT